MQDESTAHYVKEELLATFLKPKVGEDVEMKASRFLAIGLLDEGWKELGKYKTKPLDDTPVAKQVGL